MLDVHPTRLSLRYPSAMRSRIQLAAVWITALMITCTTLDDSLASIGSRTFDHEFEIKILDLKH